MSDRGAIVTTWGGGRPGVEPEKGMGVFAKALAWYDEMAKQGRISGFRVYASAVRDHGMLIAEGDAEELARITAEPESTTIRSLGSLVVEDMHVEVYLGGSPDDVFGFYTRVMGAATEAGSSQLGARPPLAACYGLSIACGTRRVKAIGRSDVRFHDLRHSRLTWSAATGASTAELMRRAGYASPLAAMRYQHATVERDRVLAAASSELAERQRGSQRGSQNCRRTQTDKRRTKVLKSRQDGSPS